MSKSRTFVPLLLTLAIGAACGGRTPTGPNPPPRPPRSNPSPNLPPVYADFSLLSMSRQPGSTIRLRDCGVERGNTEGREFCTDELQLTFAVTVDRDMDSVALRISFVVDGRRCAVAVSHPTSLNAHAAAELRLTLVDYQMRVDSAPGDLGCDPPPTTTTTMVAELLDHSEEPLGESVARAAFDHMYRFVNQ